ncbi:hypothetical protein VOLCADRAFT_105608 [Volvox carteri f. nagariensis]|uniref:Translation initiation factor 3 C-terminal domain-containing protein n=1 Tax=Volvox carteri f. nagariensis TaxID=3068 RepID=D8U1V5_VOLCA|nr:uncharacterized protein VOLCADRAFT_105608 [Volvox carteri f. nagariensis]EFJ46181.1 hypothetical protein VOLCADRAFT_105608 [Volvox carteri f. nagariensis]|eukprot:XP_002952628.1 hypothetical protein VOLCADRAFT_105608 [Volvox carteri f. nagariensis]
MAVQTILQSPLHRSPHLPRLPCSTPNTTPPLESAAFSAFLPFRCHIDFQQPRPACTWLRSLDFRLAACEVHTVPWRPSSASSAAVHTKRHPQPAVGGDDAATAGGADERGGGSVGKSAPRPKAEPTKEMHLKPRIAEHDLTYKLRQMEGWLADGIRTKLVVEFRAAEQSEAAAALMDSVVARLAGKGQPLGPRRQNKDSWFVMLRPPPVKQSKQQQAKQQQHPAPLPQQQQLKQQSQSQKEEETREGEEQRLKGQLRSDGVAMRGAPSTAA